jgi:hypothetical protein
VEPFPEQIATLTAAYDTRRDISSLAKAIYKRLGLTGGRGDRRAITLIVLIIVQNSANLENIREGKPLSADARNAVEGMSATFRTSIDAADFIRLVIGELHRALISAT